MDGDADLELYDEFGNYIGPSLDSDDDNSINNKNNNDQLDFFNLDDAVESEDDEEKQSNDAMINDLNDQTLHKSLILHEEKDYYPSAEDVYGADVEVLVQEEDTQLLSEPIIKPKESKTIIKPKVDVHLPKTSYDKGYLLDLLEEPSLNRIVSVIGSIHQGKTSLLDTFISETHDTSKWKTNYPERFTDIHSLERKKGLSIKSIPMTLLHSESYGKSHAITWIDTPGHIDFNDEVTASIAISDGALVVVDCVEGVTNSLIRTITQLCKSGIPIVLFINKIDRLVLELRLPPADAYFKLKAVIENVNNVLNSTIFNDPTLRGLPKKPQRLSPELGNVLFGSGKYGFMFSLKSFSEKYVLLNKLDFDTDLFSKKLWGDYYYDSVDNKITKKRSNNTSDRTFVRFIIEPLYKIISHVIGEKKQHLMKLIPKLGIEIKKSDYTKDSKLLLKEILNKWIGSSSSITDVVLRIIPSPVINAERKTSLVYPGPAKSVFSNNMIICNKDGPLIAYVTKLYNVDKNNKFSCLARIMSGTIRIGAKVKVLGESYAPEDEEDSVDSVITGLKVYEARYTIPIDYAFAGSLVLIDGIDSTLSKTGTVVGLEDFEKYKDDSDNCAHAFNKLLVKNVSALKLAIDPLNPAELPKMLDAVRKGLKSYPSLETHVEESGEHCIYGTGETYLDCVMHDLRNLYSGIEIKVSDPMAKFSETITSLSSIKSSSLSANGHNKITMVSEPISEQLANDIESSDVDISWVSSKQLSRKWCEKYDWDILRVRNIWAFGPKDNSTNILINDTFEDDSELSLNSSKLLTVKEALKQGFRWASKEGPLTEEPMRNVSFRILDTTLSAQPIYRGGGQLIPAMRKATYGAFLSSNPRLMEPIYEIEIQAPKTCIPLIYSTISKRRGLVLKETPLPGTPLFSIMAEVPLLDSFGFETDIRMLSQGQAFCQMVFNRWEIVPGDPLDTSIEIPTLKPSEGNTLARDFLVKTRRRKGLSDDIAWTSLVDPAMISSILGRTA